MNSDDLMNDDEEQIEFPLIEEEQILRYQSITDSSIIGHYMQNDGLKTRDLQAFLDYFPEALNSSALNNDGSITKRHSYQQKGFVTEEWHKLTGKLSALESGKWSCEVGIYTSGPLPNDTILSKTDPEVDIVAFSKRCPGLKPLKTADGQIKMHFNSRDYNKDWAKERYKGHQNIGGAGQGQKETFDFEVNGRLFSSKPINNEQAVILADQTKAQEAPRFYGEEESKLCLHQNNLRSAAVGSMLTRCIFSIVQEGVQYLRKNKKPTKEELTESIKKITLGSIDVGLRAGAIEECIWCLSQATGKEVLANSFSGGVSAAFVNSTIDIGEDLYKCFCLKELSPDDLLCRAVDTSYLTFAGYTGNWALGRLGKTISLNLGAYIESTKSGSIITTKMLAETTASIGFAYGPVGGIIGAYVGSIVLSYAAKKVIELGGEDARRDVNICIQIMNENLEINGFDRYLFFADSFAEMTELKFSFKDIIPGYGIIKDLKELQLRTKQLKSLISLYDRDHNSEKWRQERYQQIVSEYNERLAWLKKDFDFKKSLLRSEYKKDINNSIDISYTEYLLLRSAMCKPIDEMIASLKDNYEYHLTTAIELSERAAANRELNIMLEELMADPELEKYIAPFVARIHEKETLGLATEKQHLSIEEAILFVQGVYTDENIDISSAS